MLSASTKVQLSPLLPRLREKARTDLLLCKLGVEDSTDILTGQHFTLANMNSGLTRRKILFKWPSSRFLFCLSVLFASHELNVHLKYDSYHREAWL